MPQAVQYEIEQFLYREARLLDARRFEDWLELFGDELRYWVPIRSTIEGLEDGVYAEDAIAVAHIDDDKAGLVTRVKRLRTGLAHAETPPSRTRHLVSNVEAEVLEGDSAFGVLSSFLIFQGRRDSSEFLFSGRREDRLRRSNADFKITSRKVILDHTVLPRGLSIFF